MKKVRLVIFVSMLFLLSISNVFADENEIIAATEMEDTIETSDVTINQTLESYDYLSIWGSSIDYYGNGKIAIEGYTTSAKNVDSISTRSYLQRYDTSGAWINLYNIYDSQSNTDYSSAHHTYKVTTGRRYRVFSTHVVKKGSTTESSTSYSAAITAY
ncbi:hypothetical protein SAMN05446037_10447 [Anaerovirgula multivorans]|uniref:Uncharacterized protein n=1 Tax=Anaerovirgula multivorans TaxID=312168 RepID=A0A239K742_9FIRM|nr:hypothetical protein [Anaerovirgula multivorans]SNT13935.1 hypothetical protein SAMN05446037_10447 [Anaerovirgula multivorans]